MKTLKYSIFGMALLLGAALSGCQDSYDAPELVSPDAKLEANTTLAEFKTLFGDQIAVQTPYKDEDEQIPYILKGRVVSCDASGNIYRMLVIQDETAAIAISINRGSLYTNYPLGQEVVLNATGLWIGQYNNLIQLGWLGDYQGALQLSFMAYNLFAQHTELNGLPDPEFKYVNYGKPAPADSPYCIVATLDQISSIAGAGEEYRNMMSQLVEIPNVKFVDGGKETFAPYQDNADRYIQDISNPSLQLNVRCSGYSSFYNDTVPTGSGSVRGILSRYGDNWQLLLRDRNDVLFDAKGTKDDPYSVEEVIAMKSNGRTAWVQGYIVGSARSGRTEITSDKDIIFNAADTELDNNLILAPTADCRDYDKMIIVELPSGTALRDRANLLDNPQVLGKLMTVYGSFNEWLGMNGVTGSRGAVSDFEIEGVDTSGGGSGNGTEASPYSVDFIIANPDDMSSVWIEGYIVGFVIGDNFLSGAKFGTFSDGDDYNNANVIIAANPDAVGTAVSIPVALSGRELRNQFGLKANPAAYRQKVKIFGNVSETMGSIGVSAVTSMAEVK